MAGHFVGKLQLTTDQIGDFGELLAAVDLSRPVLGRYRRPLFKPVHLGGKYPAVDYIIDVLSTDSKPIGFFFAQVKSTSAASVSGERLSVTITKDRFNALAALPAPAYLIGVDTNAEISYIVAANRNVRADVPGILRAYNLKK
jgi:hypothetical protein